jgi:hypothetical protein
MVRTIVVGALVATVARADVTTPVMKVAVGGVPKVLMEQWRKAENRGSCAPVWFDDVGQVAKIRGRYFGGGWGVTVREPRRWGVAGAGVVASPQDLARWKLQRTGAGGAQAGYGLEGFTMGPDWLAYVMVPGQSCLYNVWSSRGREHLEHLIDHLRVVDVR